MTAHIAAVILAAGRGTRFAASGGPGPSKLVAVFGSKPMVRHTVEAALGSAATPVVVVTGHARDHVAAALAGLPVQLVHNPDYADGLATSLKAGIAVLPADVKGAVILLGDMPLVTSDLIDRLLAAAHGDPQADAVVPVTNGRRGNPVLLSRTLFSSVAHLEGDAGARQLLRGADLRVREFAVEDAAAALDVDDRADFDAIAARSL